MKNEEKGKRLRSVHYKLGSGLFMNEFRGDDLALAPTPAAAADLTSDSGQSQPDLGYLLEASDDNLVFLR
ncbi:hypothetical protein Vadar_026372 [Vaccinium darrowii]|uniref:Uncharacterized protein n=1 Tax=Vaccinium darrowii TaxID=229202 RepID=A0ACB7ZFF2_9ERIC|nr:hypothetical protein Vadar_026372 [Vaccinium darrowii]